MNATAIQSHTQGRHLRRTYAHAFAGTAVSSGLLLRKLFWYFVFAIFALSLAYMYFIGTAVVHIVDRKNSETEIRQLSGSVAGLEAKISAFETSVNLASAQIAGFVEVIDIAYVPKTVSLTLRD